MGRREKRQGSPPPSKSVGSKNSYVWEAPENAGDSDRLGNLFPWLASALGCEFTARLRAVGDGVKYAPV